jgi:hypothetical protein
MRTAAQFHVQGTQSPASPVVALSHTPKSPAKKNKGEKKKIRHSTRKKLLLLLLILEIKGLGFQLQGGHASILDIIRVCIMRNRAHDVRVYVKWCLKKELSSHPSLTLLGFSL